MAQHEELMKKTETMNVVMETNKMLRREGEAGTGSTADASQGL